MTGRKQSSRREFLAQSASAAAVAGLAATGSSAIAAKDRPATEVTAGSAPRLLGPNDTIRFGLI